MPGIFDRIRGAFGAGRPEPQPPSNPRTQLGDAYAQQTELLQQVRRGAASVAASRRQLATQQEKLAAEIDSLTATAHRLLDQGRDDLASEALARKHGLTQQLRALEAQHSQLQREEENLVLTSTRLQAKVDSIRTKQNTVWAQYSADEAAARVAAALGDIDLGAAGQSVQRASALLADQALETPPSDDPAGIFDELAAMKAERAARGPAAPGEGSYQQPSPKLGGTVQDSTGADRELRP